MFALKSGQVVSDEEIPALVRSLPQLGEGSCRRVYDLGDVVLKVNRGPAHTLHGSCESEADAWSQVEGTESEYLFARVLASGHGWLIMEKADDICDGSEDDYRDVKYAAQDLGIGDLFHLNLGVFAGQCKVIDYATGSLGCSPEMCECGSHRCEDCYPEGCGCCCSLHTGESGCGEFAGCNAEMCVTGACIREANVHVPQSAEWFGFKYGRVSTGWDYTRDGRGQYVGVVVSPELEHFCSMHDPRYEAISDQEIAGQGRLVVDFWDNVLRVYGEAI